MISFLPLTLGFFVLFLVALGVKLGCLLDVFLVMKDIKDDTIRCRNNTMFTDWKNQNSENKYTAQSNL